MAQDAAAADAAVDAVVAANESGDKTSATGAATTSAEETKKNEKAEEQQLEELTELLYQGFDIKDRKWRLNTYPKCFIANEAVTWMVENKVSTTRDEAVELGRLLVAANIMHHVLNEQDFGDDKLFFRFLRDEPSHGAKEKKPGTNDEWSWSDYIPGQFKKLLNFGDVNGNGAENKENDGNANNLQAKLEPASQDVNGLSLEDHDEKFYPEKTFGVYPLDKYNQILLDNVHPIKWSNPKAQRRYNMVAIGAGAAGLITAAASAALGGKVAIIEENLFGGDCLNSGCVPSKALLKSAKVIHNAINRGKEFGLKIEGGDGKGKLTVDFERVMERMREIRSKISYHDACERFTKQYGMDVFLGRGVFISENQVKIGDQVLEFARCVVATGGRASVPPIDGLKDVKFLTNHSIWNLTTLPKKLGVIGSGPIGCEMAQAFALFGSEVTVMNRSDRILGKEDIEAAKIVQKSMEECGIKFYTGLKFLKVYYNDVKVGLSSGIKVDFEILKDKKTETLCFDYLLIAAGRTPNVDNMGLEKAKIKYDIHNGIEVNNYLQTTNSNIYAAGDCCTRYQFTHMADSMARIVVRNALFFGRAKVSDLIIPWCTYTLPEVGHVGLYERDLKERNILYEVFKVELSHNDRQICEGDDNYDGFVKILVKKGSDTMLGATIVSENAGDQISEITVALQANLGLGFLAGVIHPYPTVSEGIKQTGEAYRRTMLTPVRKALLRKILQARRG